MTIKLKKYIRIHNNIQIREKKSQKWDKFWSLYNSYSSLFKIATLFYLKDKTRMEFISLSFHLSSLIFYLKLDFRGNLKIFKGFLDVLLQWWETH